MTLPLEETLARLTGRPLRIQQPLYRDPPDTFSVCPHCKRQAIPFWQHCDSHEFSTWSCQEHGDIVPINSAVVNHYPTPDWSAA